MLTTDYLRHIDGIRAFAVLIVIFFHFGVTGFAGGYIGVDIFFVISGFLITRIIQQEVLATNDFSYGQFYKRRIRRLLPALLFVFVLTTLVALILFTPENLKAFGASLVSASLSVSNIFFWSESGYFDTASHVKPLLHTWSLSVEEQFYLLWPALLCWQLKRFKGFGLPFVLVLAVLSLLLTAYFVYRPVPGFKSSIFYLTPFRVFEFSIGAVGVFLSGSLTKSAKWHELLAVIGCALIAFSLYHLHSKSVFPFLNALPPCIGALLLILARDSLIVKYLLCNRAMVTIGLMSYSIYLVHWPVYVYAKYIYLSVATPAWILGMLSLTFIVSWISYRYVETPWRKPDRATKSFFKVILVLILVLSALGAAMHYQQGWKWRYKHIQQDGKVFFSIEEIEKGKQKRYAGINGACNIVSLNDAKLCHMNRPIQILVFGNSHEPDAVNMFELLYGDNPDVNIIVFGTVNECVPTIENNDFSSNSIVNKCQQRFSILRDTMFLNKLTHIVYNAHFGFDYASKDLWKILASIHAKNSNAKIIAIGSYLSTTIDCATLINKAGSFDACKSKEAVNYFYPNEREITLVPEVKTLPYLYISKYKLLCKNSDLSSCETHANGEPMFYDQHHLSYSFARHIGYRLGTVYKSELQDLGLPKINKLEVE